MDINSKIEVYIDDKKNPTKRKLVAGLVLKNNKHTIIVQLLDGNIIKRKKNKDLPKEKEVS